MDTQVKAAPLQGYYDFANSKWVHGCAVLPNTPAPGVMSKEEFRERWGLLPNTMKTVTLPPAAAGWTISIGAGGSDPAKPTGGTYSTSVPDEATGDTIVRTWNYNQSLTEQPIREERRPMVQAEVVKPNSSRHQMKGAKLLSYADSYMEEAHSHELLLSSWKSAVGRTKIDTLVGTGISGAIAVVNLARDLGINYLIIRKDGESSHSSWPAEGVLGKNWVFVDDLVSSGRTFARVWDKMNKIAETGFESKFKGVFLYGNGEPRFIPIGGGKWDKSRIDGWLYDGGAETYRREFRNKERIPAW